ncbi:tripartite tricarboxylate transporter TctB family protein [Anderseniella sp. Alg231-50]|uniref:tripartite tricarboxylate transporter TctB family protein n=1 Tax=Anderseniella sp. Alg231-50 TaxID=1922226 RepID=UPI000D556AB3
MEDRTIQIHLGIGAIATSVFLIIVAIPFWVSSPSNVPNIILSPLFWPNVLAAITGLIGAGLIVTSITRPRSETPAVSDVADRPAAFRRLAVMAVIMTATVLVMPWVGLVWTAMVTFAATAFLVKTKHPRAALVCALLIPLLLYVFFAHIAGVAIPQGDFVRLP